MKKLLTVFVLFALLCTCACAQKNTPDTDPTPALTEPAPTEPAPTQPAPTDPAPVSSSGICRVHADTYHSFSIELMDYIGQERFEDWVTEAEKTRSKTDCSYPAATLYRCIHHFNVPRETLEEIYYSSGYYSHLIDFDLMYGSDESAVDAFYRNIGQIQEVILKRQALRTLKYNFYRDYTAKWEEHFGEYSPLAQSLREIVSALQLPREELERYAANIAAKQMHTYDYNFDLIYDNTAKPLRAPSADPHPAIADDALICGIQDYEIE